MKSTSNVYRFSGLIALLGLLALLVGFIFMILLPDIRFTAWAILALGVILLTTAFIIDFRRVSRALTGKRGRFSTGTTVMASTFIGIILLVNAISIGNYHRFDVTGVAQFTLTSQTKEVLSELETPVQALCFFTPDDPYGIGSYATNLLTEYQNFTDQLRIKRIDPDEHPDQARQYGITQYQTVVFESRDRYRLVLETEIAAGAEHAFTGAILEVTGIVQKKVYFLTGHGESSIHADYSYADEGLRNDLYLVETLDLVTTPSVPEDCAALVIAAPQQSMMNGEAEAIEHYLRAGGKALILVNPDSPADVRRFISHWGVNIEAGTVIDSSSYVEPNKDMPRVTQERCVFGLPVTYFPGATALIPQEEVDETIILREPLVWTSRESWLEKDFKPHQEPVFHEEIDRKGPLALGVIIAANPTEGIDSEEDEQDKLTRLVVIGDSDFTSNEHFFNGNNSDLFLSSIRWLTEETELIAISPKVLPFRRLVVGPEAVRFINYSSIGLLPLLVLIMGGIIWWRRR